MASADWSMGVRVARDAMKTLDLKVERCSAGGSSRTGRRKEHGGDVRLLHEAGEVPAAFGKLGYGPQGKATGPTAWAVVLVATDRPTTGSGVWGDKRLAELSDSGSTPRGHREDGGGKPKPR